MELKVLSSIFPGSRDFKCRDENGKEYYMDLYVDGGINESDWPAEKLIGKTVYIDYMHPYLFIGNGVKVLEDQPHE